MLPFGIMGIAAVLTCLLCLLLPETLNRPTRELLGEDSAGGDRSTMLQLNGNLQEDYISSEKTFLGNLYIATVH